MIVLTASQMQEMDRVTIEEIGIPGVVLMENAGAGCVQYMSERFSERLPSGVVVVAGPGNNGGDGFVIARRLYHQGISVRLFCLAQREKYKGDALVNLNIVERLGINPEWLLDHEAVSRAEPAILRAGVIVDAIFGTGLARDVAGRFAQVIGLINRSEAPVMAVDIASGLSADSGQVLGCAVEADLTVTMAYAKIGHVTWPGRLYTGELEVVDIGIPHSLEQGAGIAAEWFLEEDAKRIFRPRPADGHKGTFGHLLVVAGSRGKAGAAALVAEGGLRAGAGLVTVAAPEGTRTELAIKLTEAMTAPLPETGDGTAGQAALEEILRLSEKKRAIAIGPGIGISPEPLSMARQVAFEAGLAMVIDADGLTALSGHLKRLNMSAAARQMVLTPHPGEAARLLGCSTGEIQADRISAARQIASESGCVVVLKGFATVTARPDGFVSINSTGNSGQGSGGMGDTLTGIIGALLAQGYSAWDAARLGVWSHGAAADLAVRIKGPYGYLASEVAEMLPVIWKRLG